MENNINVLPKGTILHNGKRKYKVEKVLGTGGFGITYKVSSTVMVDNVAINTFFAMKEYFLSSCYRGDDGATMLFSPTMKIEVEQSLNDFITEAKRLNSLGHKSDNIVKVNEVFKENDTAYYIMEYLEGGNLQEYVRRNGALSETKAIALITPIAHAVDALHSERILHLDIKPENIVLKKDQDTGKTTPILIDFGLVKHFDSKGKPTTRLAAKGASDGYAPMEQYTTIDNFAPTLDVYALGATLYYLLMGKNPPKAFDIESSNTLRASLPSIITEETQSAIAQAMEKSKYERTPNVGMFLSMLSKAGNIELKAPIVKTRQFHNKQSFKRDYKKWGVGVISVMLLCCVILLGSLHDNNESTPNNKDTIATINHLNDNMDDNMVSNPNVISVNMNTENNGKTDSKTASLSINCPTKGAKIYIDNKLMGNVPWKGEVSPGRHVVEVRMQNYVSQKNNVQLAEGKNTIINFNALNLLTGQVYVNYQPSDAQVWIDGKKVGNTGETFKNLTLGEHSVEIRSDNVSRKTTGRNNNFEEITEVVYKSDKRTINISDEKLISISGSLHKVERVTQKPIASASPIVSTITEPIAVVDPMRRDIFFSKRDWNINATGKNKLKDIVNYMEKYPDSKVEIMGFDSREDGNTDNMTISKKRAEAVVQILKNSGIKANRISIEYHGDRIQPFADADNNRTVICKAER